MTDPPHVGLYRRATIAGLVTASGLGFLVGLLLLAIGLVRTGAVAPWAGCLFGLGVLLVGLEVRTGRPRRARGPGLISVVGRGDEAGHGP